MKWTRDPRWFFCLWTKALYVHLGLWVYLTAVMYQDYTQSKEGDLGLDMYQLSKISLQASHNQMWLIEIEDAPTMTPGKAVAKMVKLLLA